MTQNINRFESGVGRGDVSTDLQNATSRTLSQFAQDLMQQDNRRGKSPVDCDKYPLSKGCESPSGPGLENLHPGKGNEKEDCDEARTGKEAKDAKEGREGRDHNPRQRAFRERILPQLEIVGH